MSEGEGVGKWGGGRGRKGGWLDQVFEGLHHG